MTSRHVSWISGLAALTFAILLPAAVRAAPVKLHADLNGAPATSLALGALDYQSSDHDARKKIRITIHDVHFRDSVDVIINGEYLATMALDASGSGTLFLSSRHGDDVPDLSPGEEVAVVDSYSGRILLFGFLEMNWA